MRASNQSEVLSLENASLDGEDFSGLRIRVLSVVSSRLRRCRFRNLRLDDASFGGGKAISRFVECSFDGSEINAGGGRARFERCSFRDCEIQDFFGARVSFVDCVFTGTIRKSVFYGNALEPGEDWLNEFRGNDFSGARLDDVAFRGGIDLREQRLPEGAGYLLLGDAAAVVYRVQQRVREWSDLTLRRNALATLKDMEMDLESGQEQLFLQRDLGERGALGEAWAKVWEELQRTSSEAEA